ncbi:MAG: integrase [Clostridiales bacterium 52_15]|nr:MAG: integrase [Clostridiales bacterium 52_15]
MKEIRLTELLAAQYAYHLREEEKSRITIEKYLRDVRGFARYLNGQYITKDAVIAYKQQLLNQGYALRSVNSMLAAVNSFLTFCGLTDCRVRLCRMQREIYQRSERELSRAEYLRLLRAAEGDRRLWLLMQTICSTGIRVSELRYFTVEAVRRGEVSVACKNKSRKILLPGKLQKLLLRYARTIGITGGVIFRTRNGKPLDRSNIWAAMKRLCARAKIDPGKVFPHNLRKLFARTFYDLEKDIAKLADVLGHSSINTTRIYIMTTGQEHRRQLERLRLLA